MSVPRAPGPPSSPRATDPEPPPMHGAPAPPGIPLCTEPPALPVSRSPLRGTPRSRCHGVRCASSSPRCPTSPRRLRAPRVPRQPRRVSPRLCPAGPHWSPGGVTGSSCLSPPENLPHLTPSPSAQLPPQPHSWAPTLITHFHTLLPKPSLLAWVGFLAPSALAARGLWQGWGPGGWFGCSSGWLGRGLGGGGRGLAALLRPRFLNQEVCAGAGRVFLLFGKRLTLLRVFLQGERSGGLSPLGAGNPWGGQSR